MVAYRYKSGLKSNLKIAIVYPPKIPIVFPIKTKKGRHRTDAIILGAIRYCIGLVPSVLKASICSVTLIVAISAAILAPILPATIRPVSTGPNSLVIEVKTTLATVDSELNSVKPL
jgi:hypothetical protein